MPRSGTHERMEMLADELERLALEELVKGYPKSDAAKTAKSRLAELDKAKKAAPAPKKGSK